MPSAVSRGLLLKSLYQRRAMRSQNKSKVPEGVRLEPCSFYLRQREATLLELFRSDAKDFSKLWYEASCS